MSEAMAMLPMMAPDQRQTRQKARREIVRQVEFGATVSETLRRCPVPMHRTTVYRLLKRVKQEGEHAFAERRHGHPVKLRGEVLTWLLNYCQNHASVSSSELQLLIAERFSLSVSVSQLNRVRATHGVRRVPLPREKKSKTGLVLPSGYHEQAGGLLLLAAATETGLLTQLQQTLPPPPDPGRLPLASSPAVRHRLVLTLLFLGAVGLQRTWDLRGYTADGLALLTGRTHAYGYRYTEAFLSQVARADGAERFTEMLSSWATHLWHPVETAAETEHPHHLQALTCYLDGHRKPVYSDVLLPHGLVGRLGVVLGCRALLLLHDEKGHPLYVTTHRGDQHLTTGVPALLERYEQQAQTSLVARMIVDREGMATEFLARLHAEGRIVVTILQTNQYRDLSSFSQIGSFVPLSTDACGQVIREVAPARIALSREEYPDEPLYLWPSSAICVEPSKPDPIQRKRSIRAGGTETYLWRSKPGGATDDRRRRPRPKQRRRSSFPLSQPKRCRRLTPWNSLGPTFTAGPPRKTSSKIICCLWDWTSITALRKRWSRTRR